MHDLWQAILWIIVLCAFLASVRVAFEGLDHRPANPFAASVTHDGWCLTLLVFGPWFIGSFARREVSSLPWRALSDETARHGLADGLITVLIVITVELWLLWVPAHSYVRNHPQLDRGKAVLARCLNLSVGLLLLTPDNPVYKLFEMLNVNVPRE